MSRPGKHVLQVLRELGVNRHHVLKVAVLGAILHHQDLAVALDDVALISPTFSLSRISSGSLPSRICWRISGTHFGQSESVVRGQPSGGFDFS